MVDEDPAHLAIRPARAGDWAQVAAIHHQHLGTGTLDLERHPPAWFEALERRLREEGRQELWILDEAGQVAGWGLVKRYSEREGYARACETSVFLDSARRGRGLGSHLKRFLLERCRALGYRHVVGRVLAGNAASLRYNERLGYRLVGVQHAVGEVDGRPLDVCILELLLE